LSRAHGITAAHAGNGFLYVKCIIATDGGEITWIVLGVDGVEETCWGNVCEDSGRESEKWEDE